MPDTNEMASGAVEGAIGSMNPIGASIAGAQGALGLVQSIGALVKRPALMRQLKAFKMPSQYTDILQATEQAAQSGYDAFTLNYLTAGINKAASGALGTAARLGGDPNSLSGILDQRIQGLMKVGAENHQLNMQNFQRYLGAVDVIAKNKEAEWQSQQNLVKDKLQMNNANMQAGLQNIGSAANAFIALDANRRMESLYTERERDKDNGDHRYDVSSRQNSVNFTEPPQTKGINTSGGLDATSMERMTRILSGLINKPQ